MQSVSRWRYVLRSVLLALVLWAAAQPGFSSAKAGGVIAGAGFTGVHITLNPRWDSYLPVGSPAHPVHLPLRYVNSAYLFVGGAGGHNFTSRVLTVTVSTPGTDHTWDVAGAVNWNTGLAFQKYGDSLAKLLSAVNIHPQTRPLLMIEVDEMNGPNDVLLGTTYVQVLS